MSKGILTNEQLEILSIGAAAYGSNILTQIIMEEQRTDVNQFQMMNLLLLDQLRQQVKTFMDMN